MLRIMMYLLAGCFLCVSLFGQSPKIDPKKVKPEDLGLDPNDFVVEEVKIQETDRALVPYEDASSHADLSKVSLTDLQGVTVNPELKGVTIIEFWSARDNKDNMYWAKARELEQKYAENGAFQLISINHDPVQSGKRHRAAVAEYLKSVTAPKNIYIDRWDGFRDFFRVPGPVSYLLIDHRKQFINVGRGDDPDTIKLFEEHLPNALKYMTMM